MIQLKHDFTKLNKFVKSMTSDYVVRVGIFSDRTGRTDSGDIDNATIGLINELGSFERHIPPRSWLSMPIKVSQKEIIKEGSYGMVDLLAAGHMERVLKEFGFACEAVYMTPLRVVGLGLGLPISLRLSLERDRVRH